MRCENLQSNLPLYLDNVLSNAERAAIDEHLPTCPLCRQKLSEHSELKTGLRNISRPIMPANVLQSVRNTVKNELSAPKIHILNEPSKSLRETISYWLMPYSVGTVAASFFAFLLLMSLMTTKQDIQSIAVNDDEPSENAIMLANSNAKEVREKMRLPEDYLTEKITDKTIGVNPKGALLQLSNSISQGKIGDDEVTLVASVFANGIANIEKIIEPPTNKKAMDKLEKAFETDSEKAPFLDPKLKNKKDYTVVVFKIVNVEVIDNAELERRLNQK